jgi:hypothetical protein
MSSITLKSLLLFLFYSTASAFVQLNIHRPIDNNNLPPPQPSELDPAHWAPIATLAPLTTPFSTPTPTPSSSPDEYNILPYLDPFYPPDLKKRQGAPAAAPAAQPTAINQISPVTTYFVNSEVAPGSFAQVPVVYTQTFPPVPDQWPAAGAGTIGLGTIAGTVGVVKSKREEPTQAPVVVKGIGAVKKEMEVKRPQSWSG